MKPKYLRIIEEAGAKFIRHESNKTYYVEFEGVEYAWSNASLHRKSYPWIDNLSKYPKGFHLYKMFNKNDEIIYIGKTKNLTERFHAHFVKYRERWKDEVKTVKIAKIDTGANMHVIEMYLINKYKPKYNKEGKSWDTLTFELPEPIFKETTGWA